MQRPAAVEQLQVLGKQVGIPVFNVPGKSPVEICIEGAKEAKAKGHDVVIFDTAGRLAIDAPLMAELDQIKERCKPQNIFLVVDAMIGQDAVNTAKTFNDRLEIDGVILTKLDGDARGGAALSIREVTGKPIKFLGEGEGSDKLSEFRPEGLASRILGMGDIVALMDQFGEVVDKEKAEEDAERMLRGKFDMQDFLDQIGVIQKMGSLKDLFEKMPFFGGQLPEGVNLDDSELVKIKAMISSMTKQERERPELFVVTSWQDIVEGGKVKKRKTADYHLDRIQRVAKGAGRKEAEVKELLHKFATMRGMMMAMGQSTGLLGKVPGLKQFAQMKKLAGIDVNQIMGAAGMERMAHRFTPPRVTSAVDKKKEKNKRKDARKQRKKQRKK
jgi:signal recognition particle subunit SRP54